MIVSKPPSGLKAPGKAFWKAAAAAYEFDAVDLAPLATYCRNLDLIAQCERRIGAEGLTILGPRGKLEAHPLLAVQRSAQRLNVSLHKLLALDETEPVEQQRDRYGRFGSGLKLAR